MGERELDLVREAGFDTVRLPVEWSRVASEEVDRAIDGALRRDLDVIVDVHHFDGGADALLELWSRIAERYAAVDPRLRFELLNEPHDPMTAARWNDLLAQALAVVRASNAEREVIVGPVLWNTVGGLESLRLPDDDHLTVTVHYYSPFRFTHQGAEWLPEAAGWRVDAWGTEAERARVRHDLEYALTWARERGRPLFLGEFGVIRHAPMAARAHWTRTVREEAERLGIPWAYWDLSTDFAAFDGDAWHEPLRAALLD